MNSQEKAIAAAQAALEKKAYDLVVLQVGHLSSIADYFLIATGRSDVQVRAIARGIEERMDLDGERALVVQSIGKAISRLAAKDLNYRMPEEIPDAYRNYRWTSMSPLENLKIL